MEIKSTERITITIQSLDTPPWTPTRKGSPTPASWALSTSSVKSSTFPSVSGYWNSTPLTSLRLKSISWGNFSSMRTSEYLERQRTTMFLVYRENQITYSPFSMTEIHIQCPSSVPHSLPHPNMHTYSPVPHLPFSSNGASHWLICIQQLSLFLSSVLLLFSPFPIRTCSWDKSRNMTSYGYRTNTSNGRAVATLTSDGP